MIDRSLTIFAIGAVLGLGAAGYSLFTTHGTVVGGIPAEDIALVNQHPILRTDFDAQLETEFGVPIGQSDAKMRSKVLDDMLREELFVQRGLELDMASSDPAVRSALVASVEQQAAADAVAEQPDTATLRKFYEANRPRFSSEGTMTVTDLIAADLPTATAARTMLLAGTPLATVTARHSLKDSGKVHGDEFYFAARIHLGEKLFNAATGLTAGSISSPVTLPDGVHLLVMARNIQPELQTFGDALPQVMTQYRQATTARLLAGESAYLLHKAEIKFAPDTGR